MRKTTAKALEQEFEVNRERGLLVFNLAVASDGTIFVFRAGHRLLPSNRRYRVTDMCPHCFVERQVRELLGDLDDGGNTVVENYRIALVTGRVDELQFQRLSGPAGTYWQLNHHTPAWRPYYAGECSQVHAFD